MNIINLLGILYKEDIISNLLVGLINESENFKICFLEKIVGIQNTRMYDVEAFTRIATSQGIPDIIIKVCNKDENILVIIENKLKAEEGYDQTARYLKEECIKDLCNNRKINLDFTSVKKKFIYLTLIPEQIPTGDKFVNMTYKDLLENVTVEIENNTLNQLYKDFMTLIKDFYRGINVNYSDNLLELFQEDVDNEKKYIRFKKLMKLLKFDNDLKIKGIGKTGGTGRVGFAGQIAKDKWQSKDTVKKVNGKFIFSDNIYDIHFEFCFDVFSRVIKLPLHYETNPYIPQSRFKEADNAEYNNYIYIRKRFIEKLHAKIQNSDNKNIKISNSSNQIASIKLDINSNTTVNEFLGIIAENCSIISKLVDETLLEMNF